MQAVIYKVVRLPYHEADVALEARVVGPQLGELSLVGWWVDGTVPASVPWGEGLADGGDVAEEGGLLFAVAALVGVEDESAAGA